MQASAYEVYERIRTFLHTQNRDLQKKHTLSKASRCVADSTPETTFFIFHFLQNKDLTRKSRVFVISLVQW